MLYLAQLIVSLCLLCCGCSDGSLLTLNANNFLLHLEQEVGAEDDRNARYRH